MSVPMTIDAIPADDWLPLQEQLLRGLNHSLSNRVASISAIGALVNDPDPELALGAMLTDDATRLVDLLELYRGLVEADGPAPQGCLVEPSLARALGYLAQHGSMRSLVVRSVIASPAPSPVLLFPGTLLRLLLLSFAGVTGTLTKQQASARVAVDVREDEGFVQIGVRVETVCVESPVTARAFERMAAAVARLEGRMQEARTADSYGWVFFLPALPPRA